MEHNKNSRMRHHKEIVKLSAWCFVLLAAFYPVFTMGQAVNGMSEQGIFAQFMANLQTFTPLQQAFWALISLVPLLIIPAGLGYYSATKANAPVLSGFMILSFTFSSLAYVLSIARWNVVHLNIAQLWEGANGDDKKSLESIAIFVEEYFGEVFGVYIAEGFLALGLAFLGLSLMKSGRFPKWLVSLVSLAAIWLALCVLRLEFSGLTGVHYWGELLLILPITFLALGFGMFFFRKPREKKMANYERKKKTSANKKQKRKKTNKKKR